MDGSKKTYKTLPLAGIHIDPTINPRAGGLNEAVVEEYAAAVGAGAEFPELVVYCSEAGTNWLSEGFHRAAGYAKAGVKKVKCEVRKGERRDALRNACGSNATHGLRRTNADKRRAVEILIKEFPEWSNRRIADEAAVTHAFVNGIRKTNDQTGNVETVSTPESENASETAVSAPAGGSESEGGETPNAPQSDPQTEQEDAPGEEQEEARESLDQGKEFVVSVEDLCRDIDRVAARMKGLKASRFCYSMHVDSAVAQVEAARKTLWQGRPSHVCPYCKGEPDGCRACNNTGRVKRSTHDSGVEAVGGAK